MSKLEENMIKAVLNDKDWRSGSTEVVIQRNKHGVPVFADVYLHKHHIVRWRYSYTGRPTAVAIRVSEASSTTKSRINELLKCLASMGDHSVPVLFHKDKRLYLDLGQLGQRCDVEVDDLWVVYWSEHHDMWRANGVSKGKLEHVY